MSQFEMGNKLWMRVQNPGKPRKYTPDELWIKAQAYFNWCEANPIPIKELGGKNFTVGTREVAHPPTISEFVIFAETNRTTFFNYAKLPEYSDICSCISEICTSHNLAGAMAGLYNANIVARHLGLVDKKEVESKGNNVVLVIPDNGRGIAPPKPIELKEGEDFMQLPALPALPSLPELDSLSSPDVSPYEAERDED